MTRRTHRTHPGPTPVVARGGAALMVAVSLALTGGCRSGPSPVGTTTVSTGSTGSTERTGSTGSTIATTGTPATGTPATDRPGSSTSQGAVDGSEALVPAPAGTAAVVSEGLRPSRVSLPTLQIDAPVVDLGITGDGHVQVPTEPQDAGWLTTSPTPGQQGPAVILGHVDSTSGPAVFYPLRRLAVGDPVVVTRRDGSQVTFTVDGVQRFAKADFPTQATYGPVPGPALRLITCDGPYDRSAGGYQDNLVVFAS